MVFIDENFYKYTHKTNYAIKRRTTYYENYRSLRPLVPIDRFCPSLFRYTGSPERRARSEINKPNKKKQYGTIKLTRKKRKSRIRAFDDIRFRLTRLDAKKAKISPSK